MKANVRYVKNVTLVLYAALALVSASIQATDTPQKLKGVTVITVEEAKAMQDRGVLVVDTRVAHEYMEQHIQGAKNIPYKERSTKSVDYDAQLDSFDLSQLPADKSTPIIFYCNAGECWKSYKSSHTAIKAGYTHIYWMRDGLPEWKVKGLPVE